MIYIIYFIGVLFNCYFEKDTFNYLIVNRDYKNLILLIGWILVWPIRICIVSATIVVAILINIILLIIKGIDGFKLFLL